MSKPLFQLKILFLLVVLSMFLLSMPLAHDVPAPPFPFNLTQPDGKNFSARLVGDEWASGTVTIDGNYAIGKDGKGYWRYIDSYSGNLTGRVGFESPLSTDHKGLFIHRPPLPSPVPFPKNVTAGEELAGITGIVSSGQGASICYATVTLYHCHYDNKTKKYVNDGPVNNPVNPQITRDGRFSERGMYAFPYLPSGLYNVTVTKGENMFTSYTIVNLDARRGTATANIVYDMSLWMEPSPPERLYFPFEN